MSPQNNGYSKNLCILKKSFASLRSWREILHQLLCNLPIRRNYAGKISWTKEILAKSAKTQRY
jgi:hypothetical protein